MVEAVGGWNGRPFQSQKFGTECWDFGTVFGQSRTEISKTVFGQSVAGL